MSPKISIIDLGINNVASLKRTIIDIFQNANIEILNTGDSNRSTADILLLPGVGNFGVASRALKATKLLEYVRIFSESGRGIIGICLGMQLLLEGSDESRESPGVGLIPGKATKLDVCNSRVPNTGWTTIELAKSDKLASVISRDSCFYFTHSYAAEVQDDFIRARSHHGNFLFPAIIEKENVTGIQFHPEKSGQEGRNLLRQILNEKIGT